MKHDEALPEQLAGMLSQDKFVIFLFHGVINQSSYRVRNYTGKHIQADLFAKCLKLLTARGYALTMDEVLIYCQNKQQMPPRSFAITFDDGFENNLSVAAPILDDLKVPATIYVTTGFIENNGMSWIDRIEYAVEKVPSQTLELDWAKRDIVLENNESRISFLKSVREYVKNCPECDPNAFADEICARLGCSEAVSSNDPLDKKMTWHQVRTAHESDLLNIGGHSHTHPILSYLDDDKLAFELDTSLALLKEKASVKPTHYSYPEGLEHCYSKNVIDELKKRGVICCPTAIKGVNRTGDDLFHLKRVMV